MEPGHAGAGSRHANTNYSLDGLEIRAADQSAAKLRDRIEGRMKELWSAVKADTNSPPGRKVFTFPLGLQQRFQ